MVAIRVCTLFDIPRIQEFIDQKWKKGHILSYDTELLKWQHLDTENGDVNYIIAEREEDKRIIAIFGFIPTFQYDKNLHDQKDFWLAIWKIDPEIAPPGVGLLLLRFFTDKYQPNSIGAIGINDKIEKFYKFLGYTAGVLTQYFYLNQTATTFHIANIENYERAENGKDSDQTLVEIPAITEIPPSIIRPFKSVEYFKNRYLLHPHYQYRYFAINNKLGCIAIFIVRKISINESSCLRIVDIVGAIEKIDNLGKQFNLLLQRENAEYIDCLSGGLPDKYFINIGFAKRDDRIVIPNYFEPFEKRNIDIKFAYKSNFEPYVMFKGDSDQDRPNNYRNE